MNQIFNTGNSVLTELLGNNGVISEWDSASINLTVSSLVDEVGDDSSGWETISDEWLDHSEHVPSGLVKFDENTVVELSQSKEL